MPSNPLFTEAENVTGLCEFEIVEVGGVKMRRNPVESTAVFPATLRWGSRVTVTTKDVENMMTDKESKSVFFRWVAPDESEVWLKMYHRGDFNRPYFEKCAVPTGGIAKLEAEHMATNPTLPLMLRCAHPDCPRQVARHCRFSDLTVRSRCCGKGFCEHHLCHWRNTTCCAGALFSADTGRLNNFRPDPASRECFQCPACKAKSDEKLENGDGCVLM